MNKKKWFKHGFKDKCKDTLLKAKKLFKKKEKIEEVEIDDCQINMADLKFKKHRGPRFFVTSKKGHLLTTLAIVLPFLAASAGATLGIIFSNNDNKVIDIETNQVSHRVYLFDKDNLIVPVTAQMSKKDEIKDELFEVFNLMKTDTKLKNKYLRGFVPKDAEINSFFFDDNGLVVDLKPTFLEYEEKNDYKMFLAMSYSFLEFDGVKSVSYLVDGKPLEKLKYSKVTLPNEIDRTYGINRTSYSLDDILGKEDLVVYYQKKYDSNLSLIVPVSVYANKGDSKLESVYNAIKIKPNLMSGLQSLNNYALIDQEVKPVVKDNEVNITVSDDALLDELTIKRDVYELIKLTLYFCDLDYNVSLLVDGEELAVDGYYDDSTRSVSSIIYNSIAL